MRATNTFQALCLGATLGLTGCVTVEHEPDYGRYESYDDRDYGPPPHAPAHGYRHHSYGFDHIYDGHLGVYSVVGFPNVWFHDGWYYRHNSRGYWERCNRPRGASWGRSDWAHVPQRLRPRYGDYHPNGNDRWDRREERRDDRDERVEDRHDRRDERSEDRHERVAQRHDDRDQRVDARHDQRDERKVERHERVEQRHDVRDDRTEQRHDARGEQKVERQERVEQRHEVRDARVEQRHDQRDDRKAVRTDRKEERHEARAERGENRREERADKAAGRKRGEYAGPAE